MKYNYHTANIKYRNSASLTKLESMCQQYSLYQNVANQDPALYSKQITQLIRQSQGIKSQRSLY